MKGLLEFAGTVVVFGAIVMFAGEVLGVEPPASRAVFPNLSDDEWDEDV